MLYLLRTLVGFASSLQEPFDAYAISLVSFVPGVYFLLMRRQQVVRQKRKVDEWFSCLLRRGSSEVKPASHHHRKVETCRVDSGTIPARERWLAEWYNFDRKEITCVSYYSCIYPERLVSTRL